MPGDFKELLVWQRAMEFVGAVYRATRHFPVDERFGLTNQLRRAAVSIPSNIAEGQGRQARADFRHVLRIANGSRQEVETQLLIARDVGFLEPPEIEPLTRQLSELGRLLGGLIKSMS